MGRPLDEVTPAMEAVLRALARLHDAGKDRAGPKEVGLEVGREAGKPLQCTLVSTYLRRWVRLGKVERLPLGPKRAEYRLVEEF